MNSMWAHCQGGESALTRCGNDRWVYAGNNAAADAAKCETHADDVIVECAGERVGSMPSQDAADDAEPDGPLVEGSARYTRVCGSRARRQNAKRPHYDSAANWLGVAAHERPAWVDVDVGPDAAPAQRAERTPERPPVTNAARTLSAAAVALAAALALVAAARERRRAREAACPARRVVRLHELL